MQTLGHGSDPSLQDAFTRGGSFAPIATRLMLLGELHEPALRALAAAAPETPGEDVGNGRYRISLVGPDASNDIAFGGKLKAAPQFVRDIVDAAAEMDAAGDRAFTRAHPGTIPRRTAAML